MISADDQNTKTRDYYDRTTACYIHHFGTTLQAGIARSDRTLGAGVFREHNLLLAERAEIRTDDRVLDAGCGVGGPSIDIACAFTRLSVHGVTISPVQAQFAHRYINAAELAARVHILIADYHRLPYEAESFDTVLFLESAGYSHDQAALFTEAYRVLGPGGRIYIKDVFSHSRPQTIEERLELRMLNEAFLYQTRTLEATIEAVRAAGFTNVRTADLSAEVDTELFYQAMFDHRVSPPQLNEFGRLHFRAFRCLPVFFAEVCANR